MKDKIQKALIDLSGEALDLAEFISDHGTGVQYEVEFVGGSRPVDTPHTSAGHLAKILEDGMKKLIGDHDFWTLIAKVEEAEARYEEEYEAARKELDLT